MSAHDITSLIDRHRDGDARAFELLVDRVYADLKVLARRQLRKGQRGGTMSTTAVVNEAFLKLSADERAAWRDRSHFFAVAATAMRQILVDHARWHARAKRGGPDRPVALDDVDHALGVTHEAEKLLALDAALRRLAEAEAQAARVLECRYFLGLSEAETAAALEVSERTVQRAWRRAKIFLADELS
ncbi:MAG: ECF-type sigma factor [Acidobacteriota bacterium]